MRKIVSLVIWLALMGSGINAQDVSFTVSAPKAVSVGEKFRLVFTLNNKPSGFKAPEMADFNVLMGPSTSSSSSVEIINGRMNQNITITYTYILSASKEGKFTIGPAAVVVDGKTYSTNPVEIEVVAGSVPASSTQDSKPESSATQNVASGNKDLFVMVLVDRSSLYQGEPLVATIQIYSRVSLAGFEKIKFPSFDGFWSQEIYTPDQINLVREKVNGTLYDVGVLKKMLLYPQRSGEIVIGPMEIECVVRQRTARNRSSSIFDQFFEDPFTYTTQKAAIKSPQVKINVKPLSADKPAGFTGGVGKFTISSATDKTELNANDAITYTVKISGKGNLKLIEKPVIHIPPDFEIFDPKVSEKIENSSSGSSGSKTFEYIVIPRFAGEFKIPSVTFSYFNTESKSYKTISTDEIDIKVNKGADEPQSTVMSGFSKEDVKALGSDILFIKTDPIKLKETGKQFFQSLPFYFSYLIGIGLFLSIVLLRKKKIKERADISLVKNKRANKLALKRLKLANKYLKENNTDKFYEAVLKGLWGYLSDKLNIPVAELSRDSAFRALSKFKVDEADLAKTGALIDRCEYAQYAPETHSSQMHEFYNEAIKVISILEQSIK